MIYVCSLAELPRFAEAVRLLREHAPRAVAAVQDARRRNPKLFR